MIRPALALAAVLAAGACSAQDVAAGKATFAQCAVCHSIDGTDSVGPSLKGIMGRKAGSIEGFRYSRALRSSRLVWDAATLERFLSDPQSLVPGSLMPFAGIADAKTRADLISYLATLK